VYPDHGCHGEVHLGALPPEVEQRLTELPGEWLEYESETARIVVRHAQPSSGPYLPVIAGELVQMIAAIPAELHAGITGGDFFVHAHDTAQFARLQVENGGVVRLQWALPDFAGASKRPYRGREESALDPVVHRLDGRVVFVAADPRAAASTLEDLADDFEGLYPEGERVARFDVKSGRVEFEMQALNLDAHLLIERLQGLARPGTLDGRFTLGCFGTEVLPEEKLRIVLDKGQVLVQRPLLWPDDTAVA
jgi:hypothetical protein